LKYYFTLLTFCLCLNGIAQDAHSDKKGVFVLKGKVLGRDSGSIFLLYPDGSGKYVRDTAYLKEGKFRFEGKIQEPSFAHLIGSPADGNYSDIYLEEGHLTVTLKENAFSEMKVEGSRSQKQSDSLYRAINAIEAKYRQINEAYNQASRTYKSEKDSILKRQALKKAEELAGQLGQPDSLIRALKLQFIAGHPDCYVSATELYSLINNLSLSASEQLFGAFSQRIKNSHPGLLCWEEINKKRQVSAGVRCPDFRVEDIKGQTIALSQFQGKYVLLDFWASWCIPCRQALPHLKEVYHQYAGKGLEVLMVSLDKKPKAWQEAVEKEEMGLWYNVLSNEAIKKTFAAIKLIPAQLLIDPSGRIIWSSLDENKMGWEEVLNKQLN
jgi:thiol-disulfide isomerase/thioredoxin